MIFNTVAVLTAAAIASLGTVNAAVIPIARRSADVTCAEASRFGFPLFNSTLTPGATVSVTHDYTCSFYFGIPPVFTDYIVTVTANGNGHQPDVLAARRTPAVTVDAPKDTFTFRVPEAFYLAGASYAVNTLTTFSVQGTDGSPVLEQGGVLGVAAVDTTS